MVSRMTHWAHGWRTVEWQLAGLRGSTCLSKYIVSVSDIIRKMLSPCAYVASKVWNDIFIVNKLLAGFVTCFVQWWCIIMFDNSLYTQADEPTACLFLSAAVALCGEYRSPPNIHHPLVSSTHTQFAVKRLSLHSAAVYTNPQLGHQASTMA